MYAIVKPFIIALAIIVLLLFLIGIVRFEKSSYGCFRGKSFRFGDRIAIVDVGALKLYAYPIIFDCPEEDRYDPNKLEPCGYQHYCYKEQNEEQL